MFTRISSPVRIFLSPAQSDFMSVKRCPFPKPDSVTGIIPGFFSDARITFYKKKFHSLNFDLTIDFIMIYFLIRDIIISVCFH